MLKGAAGVTKLSITINGPVRHGPTGTFRDDLSMNDFLREYLGMTGYQVRLVA